MKAIQFSKYGGSNVLNLFQIKKPTLKKDDEVLVKILATTVNPLDIKIRSGLMQKNMPIEFPFIPGSDFAGIIERAGTGVKRLKVGDEVFGTSFGGTYTEYIGIKESQAAVKPKAISFNETAALAVPINTTLSILNEAGNISNQQKTLVHGAAGAVGNILLQVLKARGAYVIATASGSGIKQIKQFGADEVIDYKTQNFSQLVNDIDFVFDLVGGETQMKSFEILRKGAKLLSIVMPPSQEFAEKYKVFAKFVTSSPSYEKLEEGSKLVEEEKIQAVISKIMKLEEAAAAHDLMSSGGVNGKIILEIN